MPAATTSVRRRFRGSEYDAGYGEEGRIHDSLRQESRFSGIVIWQLFRTGCGRQVDPAMSRQHAWVSEPGSLDCQALRHLATEPGETSRYVGPRACSSNREQKGCSASRILATEVTVRPRRLSPLVFLRELDRLSPIGNGSGRAPSRPKRPKQGRRDMFRATTRKGGV